MLLLLLLLWAGVLTVEILLLQLLLLFAAVAAVALLRKLQLLQGQQITCPGVALLPWQQQEQQTPNSTSRTAAAADSATAALLLLPKAPGNVYLLSTSHADAVMRLLPQQHLLPLLLLQGIVNRAKWGPEEGPWCPPGSCGQVQQRALLQWWVSTGRQRLMRSVVQQLRLLLLLLLRLLLWLQRRVLPLLLCLLLLLRVGGLPGGRCSRDMASQY